MIVLRVVYSKCHSMIQLMYGLLSSLILAVALVSMNEDDAKQTRRSGNFCSTALVTRVLELVLLNKSEEGLQRKAISSASNLAIFRIERTDDCYKALNRTVFRFAHFLVASKAFGCVVHLQLFKRILEREVENYVVSIRLS